MSDPVINPVWPSDWRNDVTSKTIPPGWSEVVRYCLNQYGYRYIGCNTPITTSLSGRWQNLYFADENGAVHCLATTKGTRRTTNRPPLFSW